MQKTSPLEQKLLREEDREELKYITENGRFVSRLKKGHIRKAADGFPSLMGLVLEDMALKSVVRRPFRETPIGKEYFRRKRREGLQQSLVSV